MRVPSSCGRFCPGTGWFSGARRPPSQLREGNGLLGLTGRSPRRAGPEARCAPVWAHVHHLGFCRNQLAPLGGWQGLVTKSQPSSPLQASVQSTPSGLAVYGFLGSGCFSDCTYCTGFLMVLVSFLIFCISSALTALLCKIVLPFHRFCPWLVTMETTQSIPKGSPQGPMLGGRYTCERQPLTKKTMIFYCNTAWPVCFGVGRAIAPEWLFELLYYFAVILSKVWEME